MAHNLKWDEKTTTKFVELYARHECLWNFQKPIYRDKEARDEALQSIVDSMAIRNFDVEAVKKKIKNLRSTYAQELVKMKKSEELGGEIYQPRLKWFPVMSSFIMTMERRQKKNRGGNNDSNVDVNPADMFYDDQDLTTPSDDTDNEHLGDVFIAEMKTEAASIGSNESYLEDESEEFLSGQSAKRPRMPVLSPDIENITLAGGGNLVDSVPDEFQIFGSGVAIELQKLPPRDAILAKSEIQAILTRYRLKNTPD